MSKTAIMVFAEGFEETEAVVTADVLRRADVRVEIVGLTQSQVTGAHGMGMVMDRLLGERETADAVILPGGMPGATHLAESEMLAGVLKAQAASGRLVAAICAAPAVVLARHGLLNGRRATCYPGFEDRLGPETAFVAEPVVKDGNIITSRGPGTAFAFALAIAAELAGREKAEEVGRRMLYGS